MVSKSCLLGPACFMICCILGDAHLQNLSFLRALCKKTTYPQKFMENLTRETTFLDSPKQILKLNLFFQKLVNVIKFPVIFKIIDSKMGRGISKFEKFVEFQNPFRATLKNRFFCTIELNNQKKVRFSINFYG